LSVDPSPLAARRILVVDDQPSIRGVLEVALREAGAEVLSAADGPSALFLAESSAPDLILLDLSMPGMDGWQVIDALNASTRTLSIPVVLETSASDYASFDRARRQRLAAFISKPFRLGEVIETCRRILDGARPLLGRPERAGEPPKVRVEDGDGNVVAVGRLLDVAGRGAQVELESPLALARRIRLVYTTSAGEVSRAAEVRWITSAGNGYLHGLALRD
jgi:CheY-like chemotaxis protein